MNTRERLQSVIGIAGAGLAGCFLVWGIYLHFEDGVNREKAEARAVEVVRESGLEQLDFRGRDGILRDAYSLCPTSESNGIGDMLAGDPDDSYPDASAFDGPTFPFWFDAKWREVLSAAAKETDLCEYSDGSDYTN